MVLRSTESEYSPEPSSAEIREFMRKMGSRGGKKGGVARAAKMTPEELSASAAKAARARWAKVKSKPPTS